MARVLVVDDEQSMRDLLEITLGMEGLEVVTADSRAAAAKALDGTHFDVLITDVRLPDGDGIEILRHVKTAAPDTVVIVMTAYSSAETAVAALKLGAQDYLIKPFDVDELRIVVRHAFEQEQLRQENLLLKAEFRSRYGLEQIIGRSPPMVALFEMVRAVAGTGSTVLIGGESGTGKELVAKALHAVSPRRDAPFVSINCGALPETLLESELFGHMKGSFTDAHQNKKGLFEAAHRGTLFLDEVGETSPAMQVKLLRTLQERRVRRVGGTDEIEVDVRIVAATNQPLERLIEEGRFRQDLFYRLNVIPLRLPPLRERIEDVPLLAEQFLRRFSEQMSKPVLELTPDAMDCLQRYHWPGNVRELENLMERAVALETGQAIGTERLPDALRVRVGPARPAPGLGSGFRLDDYLNEEEARLMKHALAEADGDRATAARLLGISPRSLRYLLRKHRESSENGHTPDNR